MGIYRSDGKAEEVKLRCRGNIIRLWFRVVESTSYSIFATSCPEVILKTTYNISYAMRYEGAW